MRECDPATDDMKAGRAMSIDRLMPSPPFATGNVACSHPSSLNVMLKMDCSVDRITASFSASSCCSRKHGALRRL